jgi:TatD DNase family protein
MGADIQLVDTHCHLDFERFDEDREEVVARAEAAGVTRIIVPSLDLENVHDVLALAERYRPVYAAVGVHPNSASDWEDGWLDRLRSLAAHEKVVAIGEIGLDYYWDRAPVSVQQHAFSSQLVLAAELDLPVIVHNREAGADVIRLLAESPLSGRERPGVLHSFSAPWATAAAGLELGFFLGFTGPVTFKKADELRAIAVRVPLERLLVETDAPFLTPQPHRGKRNEPAYVRHVAGKLAEVHGCSLGELAAITTDNARHLFSL